jgi:hypothetical protein
MRRNCCRLKRVVAPRQLDQRLARLIAAKVAAWRANGRPRRNSLRPLRARSGQPEIIIDLQEKNTPGTKCAPTHVARSTRPGRDAARPARSAYRAHRTGEGTLNAAKVIVAALAALAGNVALAAAAVPLGTPLGEPLGQALGITALGAALGNLLGSPLGSVLPLASVGLLGVSAASLACGIYIVKRKKHR